MRRYAFAVAVAAALLLAGAAAWAQAPGPGGTPAQGFTVEALIAQISLYLPPEATQGIGGFGRFGGQGGGGQGGQAGAQGGVQGTAQGTTQGAGGQGARNFRQLFQYNRDPKLYLTKDQIAKLIPILQDLRANPLPTPSKAKSVQAGVDAILSVAQKAEFADYQKQMQKAIEELRKQFAAAGGGQGANGQAGNGGTFTFRQGDTGQAGAGGQAGGGGQGGSQRAQLTPTERRQRELDAFIKVLQDRQKQVSA